jgi:hypothetical protein
MLLAEGKKAGSTSEGKLPKILLDGGGVMPPILMLMSGPGIKDAMLMMSPKR